MGSDTPNGKHSLEETIKQISMLGILDSDEDVILGTNLAELLRL